MPSDVEAARETCGAPISIDGVPCQLPPHGFDAAHQWWPATVPGSLDEAWRAAEEALPEGWQFELGRLDFDGPWYAFAKSRAFWEDDYSVPDREAQIAEGEGPTPAAALLTLASRLSEARQAMGEPRPIHDVEAALRDALSAAERVKASAVANGGRLTPGAILDTQAVVVAIRAALDTISAGLVDPLDLAVAMNTAQLEPADVMLGRDLLAPATRVAEAYNRARSV